jgi:hypothetical protein
LRGRAYDALLFSLVFLIFLGLLFGTLGSMRTRSFKAVSLESKEDTGASTNLGTITFDGVSYNLPDDVSKTVVNYSAEYFTDAGYSFDHWEPTGLISVSDANANPATVTVSGDGTLKAIYAAHHNEHISDKYAPLVIPVNDKKVTVAPTITCTTEEDDVFQPHYHSCKSAQTLLVDDEWSDKDAKYTYLFEDWTDYDWNDINVSLYAVTNDIIHVEICLEDREADWENPFSVEVTPESLTIDVYWNSTDYPGDHVVQVNPNETVDIELFDESNAGDIAFINIIPVIVPRYTLTITSTSGGTTDPVPDSYLYDAGTVVSVAAIPDLGYFDHWELDGVYVGPANPIDVTMVVDHTLHAVFKDLVPMYTLTITSTTGGSTNPSPGPHSYEEGTVVSVEASPSTGYVFDLWVLDGSNVSSDNLISVTMDEDHTLHAIFGEAPSLPVGGHAMPIDNSHLLAPKIGMVPGIGLAFVPPVAMVATIILIRCRYKRSSRNSKAP